MSSTDALVALPSRGRGWRPFATAALVAFATLPEGPAEAQSLAGSASSLDRQVAQARSHDYSYLETAGRVRTFVDAGYLVAIRPTRDFEFNEVSFPYARAEVGLFVERLAAQYRAACGEKLVVTSLTRPLSSQPWNASDRSVHPTGMAVDLRLSGSRACRSWLESTLLYLEGAGVIEATRERNPPHYHVAVFPRPYAGYVAALTGGEAPPATVAFAPSEALGTALASAAEPSAPAGDPVVQAVTTANVVAAAASPDPSSDHVHVVSRGESLWTIARDYGVEERTLRLANGIAGERLFVGDELRIPSSPIVVRAELASHRVSRGESLSTIARDYGVSQEALRLANGIRDDRVFEGDVMIIPASSGGAAVMRYTVERGDSLWSIADRLGISIETLRTTNGLRTSRIYTGQVLSVPLAD